MDDPSTDAGTQAVGEMQHHIQTIAAAMTSKGRPITPDGVVEVARVAVPHAQHVGITLLRADRPPRNAGTTDGIPEELDRLQFDLRDGPCLDAATGPPVVVTPDVGSDPRYPAYGPRCMATTGIRSMMCLRLPLGGDDYAGMNFYSDQLDAFGDDDIAAGSLLIPFAALVLEARLRHEDVRNLTSALESSRMIGTAVGVLMAAHRIPQETAFTVLRRTSMDLNRKLRDVAEEVTFTGALPPRPPAR